MSILGLFLLYNYRGARYPLKRSYHRAEPDCSCTLRSSADSQLPELSPSVAFHKEEWASLGSSGFTSTSMEEKHSLYTGSTSRKKGASCQFNPIFITVRWHQVCWQYSVRFFTSFICCTPLLLQWMDILPPLLSSWTNPRFKKKKGKKNHQALQINLSIALHPLKELRSYRLCWFSIYFEK